MGKLITQEEEYYYKGLTVFSHSTLSEECNTNC